jgi:hypothetical protein
MEHYIYLERDRSIASSSALHVYVKADTAIDTANAVAGEIVFPNGLSVTNVYYGDSAVTLWIEQPSFDRETGVLSFSGITPGGFRGDRPVFSFTVVSEDGGTYPVDLRNMHMLKNDGLGTSLAVKDTTIRLSVPAGASDDFIIEDGILPEEFTPVISRTPELFAGEPFLTFAAQDKGTGIDHYEFASARFGAPREDEWITVTSPLLIPKEIFAKRLYIKAVDGAGNERVSSTQGPNYYLNTVYSSILIAFTIICVLFIARRLSSRRSSY